MNDELLLATHEMSVQTASCNRCGFAYAVILEERIACGKAPLREHDVPTTKTRAQPHRGANLAPTAAGARYGYLRLAVHPSVRDKTIAKARSQNVSVSEVVRRALGAYLGEKVLSGWSEHDVREAIKRCAPQWTRKPVEIEGAMLVFGMTPQMVDELIVELYRRGRRVGR